MQDDIEPQKITRREYVSPNFQETLKGIPSNITLVKRHEWVNFVTYAKIFLTKYSQLLLTRCSYVINNNNNMT